MLPAHIIPLYFCLERRGLAGKGSQTDLLHQGLSPLYPWRRGGCHEAGETNGTRGAPPPAPCGTAGGQPAPVPHTGSSEHDRARATRDLPGRAGCPAAGCVQRGWPRPHGTGRGSGRRRAPFPLLLRAAGQHPEAVRFGREAASPPALLHPPGPAAGSPPSPARSADSGGGEAGGSRDVPAPRSIYSAAIRFHS